MTTPLIALMTQIADDLEATTPPDRTTITYHECDGRGMLSGTSGDRSFVFGLVTRADPSGERGPEMTQVTWHFPVVIRFGGSGRSLSARADAVASEINLLARQIEKRATWPSGVLEVITGEASPSDSEDDTGDCIYTLGISALVQETD